MTRTLIGIDSTGTACVKIMKGNFDPKTTPDSLRERFYFNSKWTNQVESPQIEASPYVPFSGERFVRQPSGSSPATFTMQRYDLGTPSFQSTYWYRATRFTGIRYNLPLVDLKQKRVSNGRFVHKVLRKINRGSTGPTGALGGYIGLRERDSGMSVRAYNENGDGSLNFSMTYGIRPFAAGRGVDPVEFDRYAVIWNLPGDDTPLDGPASPPSAAGKMGVQISSSACRVAKPGYDVRTATPAQLAFDSSGRPLGVLAADDVAVPAGTSYIDTAISIPDDAVMEVSFYTGSTLYYPAHPRNEDDFGAEFYFSGSRIYFVNPYEACRARFILFAASPQGPTSGSYKVLRHFTDGGERHVQFLRPGASADPTYADVILDTRRPTIQILKEGYLPVTSGNLTQNIAFDAAGFFPYIKFATHHGAGTFQGAGSGTWAEGVREPLVKRLLPPSQGSISSGDTAYCTYSSNSATFFTFRGNPTDRYFNSDEEVVTVGDPCPIIGIRYYVLGIPI